MKKLSKLINALNYLPNNYRLYLGNDVFLTGLLDGSDKIYGFIRLDCELFVDGGNQYPIQDMDADDLNYIFNQSEMFDNIIAKKYEIDQDF